MTDGTADFLERLNAKQGRRKTVWCQHGKALGFKNDEHQVCLDQQGAYERKTGKPWQCPCKCHR